MPILTVDLADPEDLIHAQAVIAERIKALDLKSSDNGREGAVPLTPEDAVEYAHTLWNRIKKTEATRDLVRWMVEEDPPFSLEQIAERHGVDYKAIKARKFRLGRTEKKLFNEFHTAFLDGEWDEATGRNLYTMEPHIRTALRELLGSAE